MDILGLIHAAEAKKASDLGLTVGIPPTLRVHGSIEQMEGYDSLTENDLQVALEQLTTTKERAIFEQEMELDFSGTVNLKLGTTRVRCSAAMQRRTISLCIRLIPTKIPSIEELNLPSLCKDLAQRPRGLLVVTGPTGSGKSSTLASMIEYLNHSVRRRIITIEDPIEYLHTSRMCNIVQRELGEDTKSFGDALKHVLRHDPDIILVGEVRDYETASAMLTVAETGHLVMTTGHAPSTSQAVERIIDLFPPQERFLAQSRLASLLIAILCQTLVPTIDNSRRLPAVEVMLANSAVRNLIRENKIHQLPSTIRTNTQAGMKLLDHALIEIYNQKLISGKTLLAFCNDQSEIRRIIGEINVNLEKDREQETENKQIVRAR